MDTPLITIAITCYNAQDTILRAIDSALAQSWPHFEILIADDCSTDRSVAIIQEKISSIPHVRLIVNPSNLGPGGTRARLLDEAQGEFTAFFDDDDESMPLRIRTQYERITGFERQNGTKDIACYASGIRLYPNGYKKDLPAIGSKPEIPHGEGMAESILYYGRKPGWFYGSGTPTCSLMARTALLRKAGSFDRNFRRVEDLDLAIRLSLMGAYFIGCPEILFTQHATISHDKSGTKNMDAELQLAGKYKDFLISKDMYFYARTWPRLRHYHFAGNYGMFLLTLMILISRHPVKTLSHLLATGPQRLKHERKMSA